MNVGIRVKMAVAGLSLGLAFWTHAALAQTVVDALPISEPLPEAAIPPRVIEVARDEPEAALPVIAVAPTAYAAVPPAEFPVAYASGPVVDTSDPPPAPMSSNPFQDEPPAAPAAAKPALTDKPLGPAPQDNSELFLRSETVLLKPGEIEVDYGVEYIWQETRGLNGFFDTERARLRQWIVPTAIRYGWSEDLQPFVNIPWGLAEFERSSFDDSVSKSQFSIGDITAGVNYLVCRQKEYGADVVAGLGVTAPTGISTFRGLVVGDLNSPSLGNGFWALSANLNFIKSIDPAVLFGGFGYTHEFEASHNGFQIKPGEILTYQAGMGFAINDSLTFSSAFQGAWQERTQVNDVAVLDSSLEPLSLRLALTIVPSRCSVIEPFVRFGLTPDAPQADFGVIFTKRM